MFFPFPILANTKNTVNQWYNISYLIIFIFIELGLTNKQLADISGVSLGTINKIFSGATRYPQLDTVEALTSALGLDSYQYRPNSHANRLCESTSAYAADSGNGHYTLDDYYALPDNVRAELIDGYLIFMDAPTVRHQIIIVEVFLH